MSLGKLGRFRPTFPPPPDRRPTNPTRRENPRAATREGSRAARKGDRTDLRPESVSGSKGGKFGKTADALAERAKVSRTKAEQALDVAKHAKEIVEDVIGGKVPLRTAAKIARARKPGKPRAKKEKTLQQIVEAKFSRFMEKFPHHQRREVRKILKGLL